MELWFGLDGLNRMDLEIAWRGVEPLASPLLADRWRPISPIGNKIRLPHDLFSLELFAPDPNSAASDF
jgi:hypothetical protein